YASVQIGVTARPSGSGGAPILPAVELSYISSRSRTPEAGERLDMGETSGFQGRKKGQSSEDRKVFWSACLGSMARLPSSRADRPSAVYLRAAQAYMLIS